MWLKTLPFLRLAAVASVAHDAQPVDGVRDVHGQRAHVQKQAGAIEERVRLARLVQLDDEAEQADANDNVQNARHHGRRRGQLLQMSFERRVVCRGLYLCY